MSAIKNAKSGQVRFRADKAGIVHASIGKVDFAPEKLEENLNALIEDLNKAKPAAAKGTYMKKSVFPAQWDQAWLLISQHCKNFCVMQKCELGLLKLSECPSQTVGECEAHS